MPTPTAKSVLGDPVEGVFQKTLEDVSNAFEMDVEVELTITPDMYEITIYEIGLCTDAPFSKDNQEWDDSNAVKIFESPPGTPVDLSDQIVNVLDATAGKVVRPEIGTYEYAYVIINNNFGLKGSISLLGGPYVGTDGTTLKFVSGVSGEAVPCTSDDASCEPIQHNEVLNFGDWDDDDVFNFGAFFPGEEGEMEVSIDEQVGYVRALLVNDNYTTATNASEAKKIIAVFRQDQDLEITTETNGLEMKLQITDIGYHVWFGVDHAVNGREGGDGNFKPLEFGSMPFLPVFAFFE